MHALTTQNSQYSIITIVYYSLKSYNTISSLLYNSPPP